MRTSLIMLIPALLLSACASTSPEDSTVAKAGYHADAQGQLHFDGLSSGSYQCEFGQQLMVRRVNGAVPSLQIDWENKQYTLSRDLSSSGLPRYEDKQHNLTWIDLPWKGVLLNSRTRKPLVSDCVAAA
ncbi:MAG TPA: hypothetical protein VKY38_07035 [Azoarcus sp.]|nr:hypothetical protein [Azoarcus sp.]